jgi:hypothetical protein
MFANLPLKDVKNLVFIVHEGENLTALKRRALQKLNFLEIIKRRLSLPLFGQLRAY